MTNAQLTAPPLTRPIRRNEHGEALDNAFAWTGTNPNGVFAIGDCAGWTSTEAAGMIGDATVPGSAWTAAFPATCTGARRLYCFQQ